LVSVFSFAAWSAFLVLQIGQRFSFADWSAFLVLQLGQRF